LEKLGLSIMVNTELRPKIKKAKRVTGETLTFRNIECSDAEFILSLRTDENKSRYLSLTNNDLKEQFSWLETYAVDDSQAYFIIEFNNDPIGCVRLYDAKGDSFCWGSWILKDGRPRQAAIESALMVYAYAVDHLGFKSCHFDVRKENVGVLRFHEKFDAVRVGETNLDYFFNLSLQAIRNAQRKFSKFLPSGVTVNFI